MENYAIENKALEDTADFIKERGSYKYKYMCCFKYNDFKIGVCGTTLNLMSISVMR